MVRTGFGVNNFSKIQEYVSIHINLHIVTYVLIKPNDYKIDKLSVWNYLTLVIIRFIKIVLK